MIATWPRASEIDLIVFFAPNVKTLTSRTPALIEKLSAAGVLWIGWPKLTSGVATDLREGIVPDTSLAAGLVDIKVCSINDTWSGLKFVRPVKDRENVTPP